VKWRQGFGEEEGMCRVYARIGRAECAPVTRSVRLNGYVTSIRLEARFWAILDARAAHEGLTTPRFLGRLYDEVLEEQSEVRNFASLLRVACTLFVERRPEPGSQDFPHRHENGELRAALA
jgi:predicted DNA-binding ribbon-helix-helix protein